MSGVIGIDLGTADAIVASVGKGVVDIVRNEVSERKTPCVVGFTDKNRLIGEAAMTSIKSNYKNTCRNPKQLLGRTSIDQDEELIKEKFFQVCDNAIADDGTVGYRVSYLGKERILSATVVTSMLLSKLKDTADAFTTSSNSKDVVIAVPSYFQDSHRHAILDAARIAGLNCLRVMNDSTATALAYGIYRSNEFSDNTPTIVAFTSVGASHFGTSIVKFTKGHLTVLGEAIDTTVGGRYIDKILMEHYSQQFTTKTGLDPLKNAKSRFKLEEAVNKVKKILSANNEAVLGIECLLEDEDLNVVVTRDKLEELCAPMVDKMQSVMNKALKEANITIDDLHSVEIIGGVSRVPFIQRTIVDTLHKDLSRTLNADECVARGCALQAAMLSPLFKVRDFAVTDFTQQGIEVAWQQQQQATSTTNNDDVEGCSSIIKRTEVFPPRSTLNTVKMLTFYRKEAFELWAQYTNSEDHGDDASLGRYTIQVPHNSENDEGPKKIKVRAKLSLHGTFSIENAIMIEEEEYQVVEKERRRRRPINKETNDDENMVDASPSAAAATTTITNDDVNMQPAEAPAAPAAASGISNEMEGKGDEFEEDEEEELVEVTKIKTRTKKTDIPIIRSGLPGMSEDRLRAAEDDELKMRNIDREVAETDEKRNELESYIFESRDKISSPSSRWYDFLSAAQREELSNILMQTEDWVYDHYEATKAEYMDKLIEIRALGDGAESRAMEASLRPEAEARAQDVIQKYRSLAQSPDIAYAHIAIERKEYILEECHKLESWLSQQKALQVRQPLYLQPVYTVSQLNDKTDALIKLADGILAEKKPPSSPPSSKKAQDESAESNSKEEERGSPEPIVEEPDDSSDDQDGEEEEEEVAKNDDHHHMDVD